MTQTQKELLFKDICCRLPYGVKAYVRHYSKLDRKWYEGIYTIESAYPFLNNIFVCSERGSVEVIVGYDDYEIKPYLFPMSIMTEEQEKEFLYTLSSDGNITYDTVEWLNENHFDYRGLIENELAIDATGLNIY